MKKINELKDKKEELPTQVFFETKFLEIQSINKTLKNSSSEEEKLRLTMNLFKLWMRGAQKEINKVFGKEFVKEKSGRVMFSLTATGTQLRAWNGLPASIDDDHVDSCRKNLILTISGDRDKISKYLEEILKMKMATTARLHSETEQASFCM